MGLGTGQPDRCRCWSGGGSDFTRATALRDRWLPAARPRRRQLASDRIARHRHTSRLQRGQARSLPSSFAAPNRIARRGRRLSAALGDRGKPRWQRTVARREGDARHCRDKGCKAAAIRQAWRHPRQRSGASRLAVGHEGQARLASAALSRAAATPITARRRARSAPSGRLRCRARDALSGHRLGLLALARCCSSFLGGDARSSACIRVRKAAISRDRIASLSVSADGMKVASRGGAGRRWLGRRRAARRSSASSRFCATRPAVPADARSLGRRIAAARNRFVEIVGRLLSCGRLSGVDRGVAAAVLASARMACRSMLGVGAGVAALLRHITRASSGQKGNELRRRPAQART